MGKKVSILLTGSVAAQALPLLAAPILSRQYDPEAFGHFGLFTAVAAILASVANLKYDHAVLLARNSAAALHIFAICLLTSAALALVILLAISLAPETLFGSGLLFLEHSHANWLPASFMLAASTLALTSLAFRAENFTQVAHARMAQAVISTGLAILLGFWMPSGKTLITSTILGQLVCVTMLARLQYRRGLPLSGLRWSLMVRCASVYRRFPIFTTPADLLNGLAANLPMLFIGGTFGINTAGAYALAQRTLGTPLMLLSSAFTDAYKQSAAKSLLTDGSYWNISRHTMRTLAAISAIPAIACLVLTPSVVPFIFGPEWQLTGTIIQVLTIAYFLRLIVSPLSYNYYLAKRHSEDLALQLLNFATLLGLFYAAQRIPLAFMSYLSAYSVTILIIYSIYGYRSMVFAFSSRERS